MLEWPLDEEIALADLQTTNQALVNCGASISEINSVRRAFSAVKGGKLAARAPDCDQITLIVSDVPAGEERNVASGPTVRPPSDAPNPREVIARYSLRGKLRPTIIQAIENAEPLNFATNALREHFVLLNNSDFLQAPASGAPQPGSVTEVPSDISA